MSQPPLKRGALVSLQKYPVILIICITKISAISHLKATTPHYKNFWRCPFDVLWASLAT
jgi:hypothetical protein